MITAYKTVKQIGIAIKHLYCDDDDQFLKLALGHAWV